MGDWTRQLGRIESMDLDRIEGHDVCGVDGLLQDGACQHGRRGCHPGRGGGTTGWSDTDRTSMTPRGGVAVGERTTIKFLCPWSGSVPGRAEGELGGLGSERCVEPGAMTQTASKHCRQGIREGMDSRRKRGKGREDATARVPCAGSCLRETGGGRLADAGAASCQVGRRTGGRRVRLVMPGPGQPVRAESGTHSAR